ncbi:hypothetical protein J6590_078935 [Homalodisca vitripennis]|nr:hypothetical protein J6590_078935 [Homalodisca vitripennis]
MARALNSVRVLLRSLIFCAVTLSAYAVVMSASPALLLIFVILFESCRSVLFDSKVIPASSPVLVDLTAQYQLAFKSAIQGNLENVEVVQGQQFKLPKGIDSMGFNFERILTAFSKDLKTLSNLYLKQLPHNLKPYVKC